MFDDKLDTCTKSAKGCKEAMKADRPQSIHSLHGWTPQEKEQKGGELV